MQVDCLRKIRPVLDDLPDLNRVYVNSLDQKLEMHQLLPMRHRVSEHNDPNV